MVKCEKCGQDFINERQLIFIKNKLGVDVKALCGKCKRIDLAEKLRDIYKNVPGVR
jgi:hypothetical protein